MLYLEALISSASRPPHVSARDTISFRGEHLHSGMNFGSWKSQNDSLVQGLTQWQWQCSESKWRLLCTACLAADLLDTGPDWHIWSRKSASFNAVQMGSRVCHGLYYNLCRWEVEYSLRGDWMGAESHDLVTVLSTVHASCSMRHQDDSCRSNISPKRRLLQVGLCLLKVASKAPANNTFRRQAIAYLWGWADLKTRGLSGWICFAVVLSISAHCLNYTSSHAALLTISPRTFSAITFLYLLSYIKVGVTASKYIPQVLLNYRRWADSLP